MGQLTLPPSGSVYIDADAVIYSVEKIEPYWTLLQPMWSAAKAGQFGAFCGERFEDQLGALPKAISGRERWIGIKR